jgi:transcription antitermination protein NusB
MTIDPVHRHQARERAVGLLYESEVKRVDPTEVLGELAVPPDPYVVDLLDAVVARRDRIDRLIADAAIGWDLDRMAVVDRNVLRVAVAELLSFPGVPTAVILNEAVEVASAYSTDESGRFVNGVLATIAGQVRDEPRAASPGDTAGGGETV